MIFEGPYFILGSFEQKGKVTFQADYVTKDFEIM